MLLKNLRENRRSIIGVIMLLLLSVSMLLFGTDPTASRGQDYVVRVNEQTVTGVDFSRRVRAMEDRYRQMFGDQYYQLVDTGSLNINQQVVDTTISDLLIQEEANRTGFAVGDQQVQQAIQDQFSQAGGFNLDLYRYSLRNMGISAAQFEDQLRKDLLRLQFTNLVNDSVSASQDEARKALLREKTSYDAVYATIDPSDYIEKVKDIDEEELFNYYEDNAADYEVPDSISYNYAVISPVSVQGSIEVLPEDIELYYTDNLSEFQEPAKVTARHIQINYPTDAKPSELAKTKERAEEVHGRVIAGEPFAELALEFSDDIATKSFGGELGTFEKGVQEKVVEDAAFGLKEPGIAEIVSADYGYHIVEVTEYIEEQAKALDSVKGEIISRIKREEGPAYARVAAEELFDAVSTGQGTLDELTKEKGFQYKKNETLLKREEDPDNRLKGLTAQVITFPGEQVQIHDVGVYSVVTYINEYKESEIPAYEVVKEEVKKIVSAQKAAELADAAAQNLLAATGKRDDKSLKAAASELKIPVKESKGILRQGTAEAPFTSPDIKAVLFASKNPLEAPERVVTSDGKKYLVQATAITLPKEEEVEKDLPTYQKRESTVLARQLSESVLNQLKTTADIEVDPSLLVR